MKRTGVHVALTMAATTLTREKLDMSMITTDGDDAGDANDAGDTPQQSASSHSSKLDPGVRGLPRVRARTSSASGSRSEYPGSGPSTAADTSAPVSESADSKWRASAAASDRDAERQYAEWKARREEQMRPTYETASWKDVALAAGALVLFRAAARRLGYSARRVGLALLAAGLVRALFRARAPRRTLPKLPSEYRSYPVLG